LLAVAILLAALLVSASSRAEPPPSPEGPGRSTFGGLSDTTWNQLPETTPLAVMLIDEGENPLDSLSQEIADPLQGNGGLLLPVFVSAGYFDLIFSGNLLKLQRSTFGQSAESLLLGKVAVERAQDRSDPNLAIVRARCQAKLYTSRRDFAYVAFEVQGEGVEYGPERAEQEAFDELRNLLVQKLRGLMEGP
jgi:hypothetical protein